MNERDAIFARIREALRTPAGEPGRAAELHGMAGPSAAKHTPGGKPAGPATPDVPWSGRDGRFERCLPQVGAGFEAMTAAFAKASQELRTEFHLLELESDAPRQLAALREAGGWRRVAAHRGPLASPVAESLGLPVLWTDGGYDKQELEACDAGITECDALVAQTGSVVVTSASAGGRALSVLPPHHVVLARRAQLVPDLPAAFGLLAGRYGGNFPSMISFVTGPSRTGDIERILVLGAHGPKRLTVLCW